MDRLLSLFGETIFCRGLLFGLELTTAVLQRPVGLIVSAVGGTCIELWTSEDALKKYPEYSALMEKSGIGQERTRSSHH